MGTITMRVLLLHVSCALIAALSSAAPAPNGMNVSVYNYVGKTLQIREVDPDSGKYGKTLCGGAPILNGSHCTGIANDWIAVETGGGYDAGDPFSTWWGDDSWKTAVAQYDLIQGKSNYITYVAHKGEQVALSEPFDDCPWQTAAVPCKTNSECTNWLVSHKCAKEYGNCPGEPGVSEWCQWCKSNGFCKLQPPKTSGSGNTTVCGCYRL